MGIHACCLIGLPTCRLPAPSAYWLLVALVPLLCCPPVGDEFVGIHARHFRGLADVGLGIFAPALAARPGDLLPYLPPFPPRSRVGGQRHSRDFAGCMLDLLVVPRLPLEAFEFMLNGRGGPLHPALSASPPLSYRRGCDDPQKKVSK